MTATHTRLLVDRFAECYRFYRDIIRLEPKWGDESSGYASFQNRDGSPALALFLKHSMAAVLGTAALPANPAGQDIFMLVFQVDDVDAEVQRIRAMGGELLFGPQTFPDWGYRGAYLRDPEGNLIELSSGIPESDYSDDLREANKKYLAPDAD